MGFEPGTTPLPQMLKADLINELQESYAEIDRLSARVAELQGAVGELEREAKIQRNRGDNLDTLATGYRKEREDLQSQLRTVENDRDHCQRRLKKMERDLRMTEDIASGAGLVMMDIARARGVTQREQRERATGL